MHTYMGGSPTKPKYRLIARSSVVETGSRHLRNLRSVRKAVFTSSRQQHPPMIGEAPALRLGKGSEVASGRPMLS